MSHGRSGPLALASGSALLFSFSISSEFLSNSWKMLVGDKPIYNPARSAHTHYELWLKEKTADWQQIRSSRTRAHFAVVELRAVAFSACFLGCHLSLPNVSDQPRPSRAVGCSGWLGFCFFSRVIM
jgi:hypothetical protein